MLQHIKFNMTPAAQVTTETLNLLDILVTHMEYKSKKTFCWNFHVKSHLWGRNNACFCLSKYNNMLIFLNT